MQKSGRSSVAVPGSLIAALISSAIGLAALLLQLITGMLLGWTRVLTIDAVLLTVLLPLRGKWLPIAVEATLKALLAVNPLVGALLLASQAGAIIGAKSEAHRIRRRGSLSSDPAALQQLAQSTMRQYGLMLIDDLTDADDVLDEYYGKLQRHELNPWSLTSLPLAVPTFLSILPEFLRRSSITAVEPRDRPDRRVHVDLLALSILPSYLRRSILRDNTLTLLEHYGVVRSYLTQVLHCLSRRVPKELPSRLSPTGVLSEVRDALRGRRMVVFCGAGISRNSGVPVVSEILPFVLSSMGIPAHHRAILLEAGLPFELFLQTFGSVTDMSQLWSVFMPSHPNSNHLLLAKLVKKGYLSTIATTNFDDLIERALSGEGLKEGRDFYVFYREDDFSSIDWDGDIPRIVKLHGSIVEPDAMAATIAKVGGRELSAQRAGVVRSLFSLGKHDSVLILGYSCADVFDVSPAIESVAELRKRVVYLQHHEGEPLVEPVAIKQGQNPFARFEGERLSLSTDDFTRDVWSELLDESYEYQRHSNPWKDAVLAWLGQTTAATSPGICYWMIGDLFEEAAHYHLAIEYFQRALAYARQAGRRLDQYLAISSLGATHYYLGLYRSARAAHLRCLRLARSTGRRNLEAQALNNLGLVDLALGRHNRARHYFQKTLDIADEIPLPDLSRSALNNLGLIHDAFGDYARALKAHDQACRLSGEIGDKNGECTALSNIGRVYSAMGKHQQATEVLRQALEIARSLSSRRLEALSVTALGQEYQMSGRSERARQYLERGVELAQEIGDRNQERVALSNLGQTYNVLKQYRAAVDTLTRAVELSDDLGADSGKGVALNQLGLACCGLKDFDRAIRFHQEALALFEQAENRRNMIAAMNGVGNTYREAKQFASAEEWFRRALQLLDELETDQASDEAMTSHYGTLRGHVLTMLSLALQGLGRYGEAASCLEEASQLHGSSSAGVSWQQHALGVMLKRVRRKQRRRDRYGGTN